MRQKRVPNFRKEVIYRESPDKKDRIRQLWDLLISLPKIDLFKETCHKFLSKINDPKIVTERLKKDIIKLVIDEVVIEVESVKIFATIPLPNKIHEREMDKTDIPGPRYAEGSGEASTFNAGATLGPVNETNMARIWNKHKQSNTPLKRKVFVGLSGGVDSAVSAAILKQKEYDVTGAFIKIWQPDWLECTWREDRLSAMRVAATLDIPFQEIDLTEEYKKTVIDYMISEYAIGRTPNPDVICNRTIKFGAFKDWALGMGADFIATGHYGRVKEISSAPPSAATSPHNLRARSATRLFGEVIGLRRVGDQVYQLLAGIDKNKDQSYFLWTLTQDDLSKTIFPVGNLTKPEVRKLARRFGLPNAEKKDSQGLCFVGALDVKEFLSKYIETKVGNVLDEDGKVIGWHHGALFFTIGERHGFTVTNKTPHDKPFYVTVKNMERNTITVSERVCIDGTSSAASTVVISNVNWISGPIFGKIIQARSRYRQSLENMMVESFDQEKKSALIKFEKPQTTLASGQSLVMYDGEVCLGGGVIV